MCEQAQEGGEHGHHAARSRSQSSERPHPRSRPGRTLSACPGLGGRRAAGVRLKMQAWEGAPGPGGAEAASKGVRRGPLSRCLAVDQVSPSEDPRLRAAGAQASTVTCEVSCAPASPSCSTSCLFSPPPSQTIGGPPCTSQYAPQTHIIKHVDPSVWTPHRGHPSRV